MKKINKPALTTTFAAAALLAALPGVNGTAWAQDVTAAPPATAKAAPAAPAVVPSLKLANVSASEAVARVSKAAGVLVVADNSVANTAIPAFSTLGGNLPDVLTQLVAILPKGTVVRRVLLPALAPNVTPPSADVIAKLASVNDGLVGSVMGMKIEMSADSVNVMGRVMTMDEAAPVIASLNLKPVYLLTNPGADGDLVQKMLNSQNEFLKTWMGMTPEQRGAVADKQIDGLLNMDPAARQAMFAQQGQMAQKFIAKIQSLPEGQRQQFWKDLTGGKFDGTMPPGAGKTPPPPGLGGN